MFFFLSYCIHTKMNKLISRSLFSKVTKPYFLYATRQCQTRFLSLDNVGNANDRLRSEEETYCNQVSTPLKHEKVLDVVIQETVDTLRNPHMMVSKVQGKALYQLVRLLRPTRVLEIGGFTGYSAIAMGSALLPNASLLSLELDSKHIVMARHHVKLANLQDQVKFKQGSAGDSLIELANQNPGTTFDFIFLDADKGGYIKYYDIIMKHDLLSEHGVIVADNVLFHGQVHKDESSQASKNVKKTALKVDTFNQHVFNDSRVEVVVLPIFDGLSLIRKK